MLSKVLDELEVLAKTVFEKPKDSRLYSSKNLGLLNRHNKKRKRLVREKKVEVVGEEGDAASDDSEPESIVSLERQMQDQSTISKIMGKQSYDYIDKIKDMYSEKQPKAQESESDDEATKIKKMSVVDDRITEINDFDAKKYQKENKPVEARQLELQAEAIEYKNKTSKVRGLNLDKDA